MAFNLGEVLSRANRSARRFAASLANLGRPTAARGTNQRPAHVISPVQRSINIETQSPSLSNASYADAEARVVATMTNRLAQDIENTVFRNIRRDRVTTNHTQSLPAQPVISEILALRQRLLDQLRARQRSNGDVSIPVADIEQFVSVVFNDSIDLRVRDEDYARFMESFNNIADGDFFSRVMGNFPERTAVRTPAARPAAPTPAPAAVTPEVRFPRRSVNGFMVKEVTNKDGTVVRVIAENRAQSVAPGSSGEVENPQPSQEKASEPAASFPLEVRIDTSASADRNSILFVSRGRVVGAITGISPDDAAPDSVRDPDDQT